MEYMIAIYDKTISPHASEIDAWGENIYENEFRLLIFKRDSNSSYQSKSKL